MGRRVYRIAGVRGRLIRWLICVLLLTAAGAATWLWLHVNARAKQVLLPGNPLYSGYDDLPAKAQGVQLSPFTVKGWDGAQVQVCIVSRADDSEGLTPRQQALLERLEGVTLGNLGVIDYALVSVDWDYGIRSALPLAEALAAAGITCVLWEPRGSNSTRTFCTHGLRESEDVPFIINALEQRTGRKDLEIIGVGRGFGAELMLQAAAVEPRLSAVVAVDAAASLNKILKRAKVSAPMRELIGWRMNQLTGLEPFDIAAVKSASLIPRETPVLIASMDDATLVGTLEDAVTIFSQLHSDTKRFITPRKPGDAPEAQTRSISYTIVSGTREIVHEVEVELVNDAEDVMVEALKWLNSTESAPGGNTQAPLSTGPAPAN